MRQVAGAAPIINLDALLEGGKLKKQKTAEVPRGAPAAPYQFPLLHAAANFAFGTKQCVSSDAILHYDYISFTYFNDTNIVSLVVST